MIVQPSSLPPDDAQRPRSLPAEDWAVVASAADLARKATTLADRYDTLPDLGDARASERRESVARLRAAATAAQLLITSLMSSLPWEGVRREPAPSSAVVRSPAPARNGPADARDAVAALHDTAAETRDVEASVRDRQARVAEADLDPGFALRFLSACDRDEAAGDRARAFEDRRAARDDRMRADRQTPRRDAEVTAAAHSLLERLDARRTSHQAQGMLMASSGMSAAEAFEVLLLAAAQQGVSLPQAAVQVVQQGFRPDLAARGSRPQLDAPA